MSIYSTLRVTRNKAIETVALRLELALARAKEGRMTDEELTSALDDYLRPQLNNVCIVDDDSVGNDDERVPYPLES